jgi:hypothetical protein
MQLAPGETGGEGGEVAGRSSPTKHSGAKPKPVRVTLSDVKRKSLPPLDDAFCA